MTQNMKDILVTRSSMPSFEEYMEEIRPIWDSHWLTNMGPKHAELAEKLREYLGWNESTCSPTVTWLLS